MPRNSQYRKVYDARQVAKSTPPTHSYVETPEIVPPSGYPVQPAGHELETA